MYQPHLFISIGKDHHFFTLRETYIHYRYISDGEGGYSVETEVRSHHHCNLAQDAAEAHAKAVAYAEQCGLPLSTKLHELDEQLAEIKRATADELAAREERRKAQEAQWAEERAERDAFQMQLLEAGIWPMVRGGISNDDVAAGAVVGPVEGSALLAVFGRDGKRLEKYEVIRQKDVGLLTWFARFPDFEGPVAKATQKWINDNCADLLLPEPDKTATVGTPGQRIEVTATVIRTAHYDTMYGTTFVTVMVDADRRCIVIRSGAFRSQVGRVEHIKGTVKGHDDYKGQMQTTLQRVVRL